MNNQLFWVLHEQSLYCFRNYLLSFTQSFSRSALKCAKEDIFAYKPKKPETAFLLYIKSVRPKFVGEHPDIKASEIVKKASKEWAKLDPIQKEDFKKVYHQNYELYVQQLKEYENSLTEEQRQLLKERKKRHQDSSIEMDSRRVGVSTYQILSNLWSFL